MERIACLKLALVTTLAVAIAAISAPVAQAAERRPTCQRAHSKTVAQNRVVRVYKIRRSGVTALYACRRSTGRRVRLARAFDDDVTTSATFKSVRLSGYYVAWASTFTDVSCKAQCPPGYEPTTRSIKLYNVRRRRSRTVAGYPLSRALVLSHRGGVAWASQSDPTRPVEIRASVRRGDNRLIDRGNIPPRSLAIDITIISWMRDGVERFARLR